METIYDHTPSEAELSVLFPWPISKNDHLALDADQQTEYANIYRLYALRGELPKAETYREKITDPIYRVNLTHVDTL